MTSERKEDWINITTPEGKKMIASPGYVKKLLGVDLSNVYNRLERIERQLERLEAPGRQEEILKLLRENGKHNLIWISNRVMNYQWYDLRDLIDKGFIVESKAGSTRMYSCVVEK